uniref:Protein kinase domain-containing protein n=1 Tax=Macrostomum lignano TaxID=282301 RepID=A0A1I8FFR2_9PLAT
VDPHAQRGNLGVIGKFRTGRTILLRPRHCTWNRGGHPRRRRSHHRSGAAWSAAARRFFPKKALGDGYALDARSESAEAPSEAAAAADAAALVWSGRRCRRPAWPRRTTSEIPACGLPPALRTGFCRVVRSAGRPPCSGAGRLAPNGIDGLSLGGGSEGHRLQLTARKPPKKTATPKRTMRRERQGLKTETPSRCDYVAESSCRPNQTTRIPLRRGRTSRLLSRPRARAARCSAAYRHTSSRAVARWLARAAARCPPGLRTARSLSPWLRRSFPGTASTPPLELAPWYAAAGGPDPARPPPARTVRTFVSLTQPGASAAQPSDPATCAQPRSSWGTRCNAAQAASSKPPRLPLASGTGPAAPGRRCPAQLQQHCRPVRRWRAGVRRRRSGLSGGRPDPAEGADGGSLMRRGDRSGRVRAALGGLADYLRCVHPCRDYHRRRFWRLRAIREKPPRCAAGAARAGAVDMDTQCLRRSLQLLGVKENNSQQLLVPAWGRLSLRARTWRSDAAAAPTTRSLVRQPRLPQPGPPTSSRAARTTPAAAPFIPGRQRLRLRHLAWTPPGDEPAQLGLQRPCQMNAIRVGHDCSVRAVRPVLRAGQLCPFSAHKRSGRSGATAPQQLVSGVGRPAASTGLAWHRAATRCCLLFRRFDSQEFVMHAGSHSGRRSPCCCCKRPGLRAAEMYVWAGQLALGVPSKGLHAAGPAPTSALGLRHHHVRQPSVGEMIGEQNDERISEVLSAVHGALRRTCCLGQPRPHGAQHLLTSCPCACSDMAGKRASRSTSRQRPGLPQAAPGNQARNYIIALAIQKRRVLLSPVLLIEYRSTLLPRALSRWRRNPPGGFRCRRSYRRRRHVAAEEAPVLPEVAKAAATREHRALELRVALAQGSFVPAVVERFRLVRGEMAALSAASALAVGRAASGFGLTWGSTGHGKKRHAFRMLNSGDLGAQGSGDAFHLAGARWVHRQRLGYAARSPTRCSPVLTAPRHARRTRFTEQYSGGQRSGSSPAASPYTSADRRFSLGRADAGMDPKARRSAVALASRAWCARGFLCYPDQPQHMEDCQEPLPPATSPS